MPGIGLSSYLFKPYIPSCEGRLVHFSDEEGGGKQLAQYEPRPCLPPNSRGFRPGG